MRWPRGRAGLAGRCPAPELGARGWQPRAAAAVWAIRFQMGSARKRFFVLTWGGGRRRERTGGLGSLPLSPSPAPQQRVQCLYMQMLLRLWGGPTVCLEPEGKMKQPLPLPRAGTWFSTGNFQKWGRRGEDLCAVHRCL